MRPKFSLSKIGVSMNDMYFSPHNSRPHLKNNDQLRQQYDTFTKQLINNGFNVFHASDNLNNGDSKLLLNTALKEAELAGNKRENFYIMTNCGILPSVTVAKENKGEIEKSINLHNKLVDIIESRKAGESDDEIHKKCSETSKSVYKSFIKPNNSFEYSFGSFICYEPDYLNNRIEEILETMNTPYLDCLILESPELFLQNPKNPDLTPHNLDEKRKSLFTSLKTTFDFLESKVSEGKIKEYGISCDTFGLPDNQRNHTYISYEEVENILKSISPSEKHSMKAVHLPISLFQQERVHLAKYLHKNNIKVFSTSPLLSFSNDGIWTLTDYKPKNYHLKPSTRILEPNIDDIPNRYEKLLSFLDEQYDIETFNRDEVKQIIHTVYNYDSYVSFYEFEQFMGDTITMLSESLKHVTEEHIWKEINDFLVEVENSVRYVAHEVTEEQIKLQFPNDFHLSYNPKDEHQQKKRITQGIHSIEEFAYQYLLNRNYITSILHPFAYDYEIVVPSRLMKQYYKSKNISFPFIENQIPI